MFINGEKYGHAPMPLPRPGADAQGNGGKWMSRDALDADLDTWDGLDGSSKTQKPPFLMVGCHRTSDDTDYRDYGYVNSQYDELAFWDRRLVTNRSVDETLYFAGGYLSGYEDITKDAWSKVRSLHSLLKKNQDVD
jgi:hypothetical protein